MKPLHTVELEPIFPHERTELYRRARELHAFSAQLEAEAGNTRYFGALTQAGLLAMLSVASAGVAPSDRARARCLARLRAGLSRFASTLRSMADRALLEDNAVRFGARLVAAAEALVSNFDIELKAAEALRIVDDRDAERERLQRETGVERTIAHDQVPATASASRGGSMESRPTATPANDETSTARARASTPLESRAISADQTHERRNGRRRGS